MWAGGEEISVLTKSAALNIFNSIDKEDKTDVKHNMNVVRTSKKSGSTTDGHSRASLRISIQPQWLNKCHSKYYPRPQPPFFEEISAYLFFCKCISRSLPSTVIAYLMVSGLRFCRGRKWGLLHRKTNLMHVILLHLIYTTANISRTWQISVEQGG